MPFENRRKIKVPTALLKDGYHHNDEDALGRFRKPTVRFGSDNAYIKKWGERKMKTAAGMVVMVLIIGGLIAVSTATEPMPGPDADGLWTYITKTSPYQKWEFWPGHDSVYPGKSPHGAFLKLHANPSAIAAAKAGEPMPEGRSS